MECKVIVNLMLSHGQSILFVRYSSMPDQQAGLLLPSAVVAVGGQVQDVPIEIMREQLGIPAIATRIKDVDSFVGQDGTWHIALTFSGDIASTDLKLAEVISEACWLSPPSFGERKLAHSAWTRSIIKRALVT
jgi:hypothetical protein